MGEENIFITGFGPFGEHKINASWSAVQLLKNYKLEGYNIITKEIPVTYKFVEENIKLLWRKYNPKLVIHVGVSHIVRSLNVEMKAHRKGYNRLDAEECSLKNHECTSGKLNDILETSLNVPQICKDAKEEAPVLEFCQSEDAGKYLCEFTYFNSLSVDSTRTLFVHVPMLDSPYSAEQLAEGLFAIIKASIKQI